MRVEILLYKLKFFIGPVLLPLALCFVFSIKNGWALAVIPSMMLFTVFLDALFPMTNISSSSEIEQHKEKLSARFFDLLAWAMLPLMIGFLVYYLRHVSIHIGEVSWLTILAWTVSMGIILGTLGFNVGHELGHRQDSWQRFIGKGLLLTQLNMNYYIEHNWGHHKQVATPEDPGTAYRNEPFYTYVFRSIFSMWWSSIKIQKELNKQRKIGFFSIYNDILWYSIFHALVVFTVYYFFDLQVLGLYLLASFSAAVLAQSINYSQHYGLRRKRLPNGSYERTLPIHSWNSNHYFSEGVTFNLPRHSDHHFIANREYQLLRDYENKVPTLPFGYTGMVLLSFVPPLYFRIMNRRLDRFMKEYEENPSSFTFASAA